MTLRITEMPDKTVEIYDLSEEGGTQIRCTSHAIELWLIPQYGGEPAFVCNCSSIPQALEIGRTYT